MTDNHQSASNRIADEWEEWLSLKEVQRATSLCSALCIETIRRVANDESHLEAIDHWAAYAWLSGQRDASFYARVHDDNDRIGRVVFLLSLRTIKLLPRAMRILDDLTETWGIQDQIGSAQQSEQMVIAEVQQAVREVKQNRSIGPLAASFEMQTALSAACRRQYESFLSSFEEIARRNARRINSRAARQA